jgi:Hemolysins and related proteins containing CBS domains
MEILGLLFAVVFFVILEGIFSGSEIALVKTDRSRILALYKKTKYEFLMDFYENPEDYITLTMLGYTVSIVLATTFYTLIIFNLAETFKFLSGLEVLFSATLVIFTLIFGEFVPKGLFHKHSEKVLVPSLWFLSKLKRVLLPILKTVRVLSRQLSKRLEGLSKEKLSRRDLLAMEEELAEGEELRLAVKLLSARDTYLSEVLKPIHQVVMISENATVEQAITEMKRSGYKKLPVYRGRVDEIVGYVDMFDLAEWYGRNLSIKNFIRPVAVFPEFASLQEALETFKSTKEGMGIVVDELGVVLGIVTIDDLSSFFMGGLGREELEEDRVVEIEKDKWIVDGRFQIEDLERLLGVELPKGPYSTVAGLLIYHLRRIPKKGEQTNIQGVMFKVVQADEKRVQKVMVEKASS